MGHIFLIFVLGNVVKIKKKHLSLIQDPSVINWLPFSKPVDERFRTQRDSQKMLPQVMKDKDSNTSRLRETKETWQI